jgi:hypothetical protein
MRSGARRFVHSKRAIRATRWSCARLRRGFCRSIVHVPTPRSTHCAPSYQAAAISSISRLPRSTRSNGCCAAADVKAGGAATCAPMRSCSPAISALNQHMYDHYAIWRQAAERVRAFDLRLGACARQRREVVNDSRRCPVFALTAIAVSAEVNRFPSAKHAASYSGLVPRTFQSGERDAHGHITKRGSPIGSAAFYSPCCAILPTSIPPAPVSSRATARGLPPTCTGSHPPAGRLAAAG